MTGPWPAPRPGAVRMASWRYASARATADAILAWQRPRDASDDDPLAGAVPAEIELRDDVARARYLYDSGDNLAVATLLLDLTAALGDDPAAGTYRDAAGEVIDQFTLSHDSVTVRINGFAPHPSGDRALMHLMRYTQHVDRFTGEGPWVVEYDLRNKLLAIPGVAQVSVIGGELPEYQVLVRQDDLRLYNLTVEEVVEAARASHSTLSAPVRACSSSGSVRPSATITRYMVSANGARRLRVAERLACDCRAGVEVSA